MVDFLAHHDVYTPEMRGMVTCTYGTSALVHVFDMSCV